MTLIEIKDWKNQMVELAKTNLRRDGFLTPVTLMLIEQEGEIGMGVYEMNMASVESKNMDVMKIKMITSTKKVLALLMMSETWMRVPKQEEIDAKKVIAPSESDDKDEALMITLETNAVSELQIHKMIRNESDEIIEFEQISDEKGGNYIGRFSNMLAKLN
jgi:hypothetical protein